MELVPPTSAPHKHLGAVSVGTQVRMNFLLWSWFSDSSFSLVSFRGKGTNS